MQKKQEAPERETPKYSRILNEDEVKGKECSSELMELNIVCCWNRRGEESMAMKKFTG